MPYKLPAGATARTRATSCLLGVAVIFSVVALVAPTRHGVAFAQSQDPSVPIPVANETSPSAIRGQYIVVFSQHTSPAQFNAVYEGFYALGGEVLQTYTSALQGVGVRLPQEPGRSKAALDFLRSLPQVASIEADQVGQYHTIQPPNPPGAPPTGLDRVDRRLLPLNGTYTYSETGTGVHAYVIDSGIRITHNEFGGRATNDFTVAGADFSDCFNHGTHVAGTVGGATFGVAKAVAIHNVRVGSAGTCTPTTMNVIAGVDWVTANRILPAVANISIGVPVSVALETAIANSIAAGVTYAVSAGNGFGANACNQSPASQALAIVVGNTDPSTDTRAASSNIGNCIDLFAPGENILSASRTGDNATTVLSGTSMASPHVAGVAARYLQTHAGAAPAAVWTAIHNANNVATTMGWGGVVNAGAGSPNELLHYGSLNDGFTDGDPHIRTTDGIHYDFQSAGEFTLLRDGNGMEIQTRQTPVSTQPPIGDPHTGLAACVSVNEAVAARVAGHRVTYQPTQGRMMLRIDGKLTPVTAQGVALGQGAHVVSAGTGNGITIQFPDGTRLTATSHFWGAPHNRWYLNVSVLGTRASEGVMGDIAPGSWLPTLPDGTSLGPKPPSDAQRFLDLYRTFADAWRVRDETSLFDYGPGESAETFAIRDWPSQSGSCFIPEAPFTQPMATERAVEICRAVRDKHRNANCVFDVALTGHAGFAQAYFSSQRIEAGTTKTELSVDHELGFGITLHLAARVSRAASSGRGVPVGSVRFLINGELASKPIELDARGHAAMTISQLAPGRYKVEARYAPVGDVYLASFDDTYIVVGEEEPETEKFIQRH